MRCYHCETEIDESDARYAFDEDYCQICFDSLFTYCERCDEVIYRESATYDNDGDPYCDTCWHDDQDDDAPDNPDVYDSDRQFIIQLSRSWLQGKNEYKRLISINQKDFLLEKIREKVGLVDNPIYLFGLQDREEYQVSASPNIIESAGEYILLNNIEAVITEGIGCNRLGISYTLRQNHKKQIVDLIKQITSNEVVPA